MNQATLYINNKTMLTLAALCAAVFSILLFGLGTAQVNAQEEEIDPGNGGGEACRVCVYRPIIGHYCDDIPEDDIEGYNECMAYCDSLSPGACDIKGDCAVWGEPDPLPGICKDDDGDDGDDGGGGDPDPDPTPPGTSTLNVTKKGTGTGTVRSTAGSPGINCGSTCSATGTGVTWHLNATASSNSTFVTWSEPKREYCSQRNFFGFCTQHDFTCGNIATKCIVTVSKGSSKTVSATFNSTLPPEPTNNPPSLTITGPSVGLVSEELSFNFRATDPNGDRVRYQISWDDNTSIEEILPPSKEVCWFPGVCFNVAQYVNSGASLSGDSSWSSAGVKRFRARAHDSRGAYSSWATKTVTIGEAAEPEPEPAKYQLNTAILPSDIAGSASGAGLYTEGEEVTAVATPNPGYTFTSWSRCDSVSSTVCTVTMNRNRTVTAQFEQTLKQVKIIPEDQWVPQGGSTTITWEGGSDDATCDLYENGSLVSGGLSTPPSAPVSVGPIARVTEYELICTDGINTVDDSVFIYVLPTYGEF